jgi:hypothetical protein
MMLEHRHTPRRRRDTGRQAEQHGRPLRHRDGHLVGAAGVRKKRRIAHGDKERRRRNGLRHIRP